MITVRVCYRKGKICLVSLVGHGGGEYGKDLVCAGASACFIGALNALEAKENFECRVESGNSSVKPIGQINEHDEVVLETLVTQLSTISESYPKNLSLIVSRKEG